MTINSPKFGQIGASFILIFGEIGALQNSGSLLKIRGDWSLPFGEIEVSPMGYKRVPVGYGK